MVRLHPGKPPQWRLHEQLPLDAVDYLGVLYALVTKQSPDERGTGLRATGAHPGPRYRLDLVDIPVASADQLADLGSRHPLAAADDRIVADPLHVLFQGLANLPLLHADAGDLLCVFGRGPYLDQESA